MEFNSGPGQINNLTGSVCLVFSADHSLSTMSTYCAGQYVRQFGQKLVHRRGEDTIKESDGLKIHLSATELVFLGVGQEPGSRPVHRAWCSGQVHSWTSDCRLLLVAGLSSLLSRLCYVEFDARVPRSSSAYVCSCVMMGQLWAFVVGWNIILLFLTGEVMGPGDRCGGKVWGLRSGNWEMI